MRDAGGAAEFNPLIVRRGAEPERMAFCVDFGRSPEANVVPLLGALAHGLFKSSVLLAVPEI